MLHRMTAAVAGCGCSIRLLLNSEGTWSGRKRTLIYSKLILAIKSELARGQHESRHYSLDRKHKQTIKCCGWIVKALHASLSIKPSCSRITGLTLRKVTRENYYFTAASSLGVSRSRVQTHAHTVHTHTHTVHTHTDTHVLASSFFLCPT